MNELNIIAKCIVIIFIYDSNTEGRKQAYPGDMADVAHPSQWDDSKWSPADSECPKSNQ